MQQAIQPVTVRRALVVAYVVFRSQDAQLDRGQRQQSDTVDSLLRASLMLPAHAEQFATLGDELRASSDDFDLFRNLRHVAPSLFLDVHGVRIKRSRYLF